VILVFVFKLWEFLFDTFLVCFGGLSLFVSIQWLTFWCCYENQKENLLLSNFSGYESI